MWPFRGKAPKVVFDDNAGDETARMLDAAARRGDWRTVGATLDRVTDTDLRNFYLGVVTDLEGAQPWIDEWVAAEPGSALPYLVKGCHFTAWAWEARTSKQAKYVSQEQFAVFFRRLKVAEDNLDEALARDPGDANIWAQLIQTAIGRQLGLPEAERRFKEVTARHRWHRSAHHKLLQQKCAKWGGSDELALTFARDTVAEMPPGCSLGSLVAVAHFEQHLQDPGERHLRRPEVVAEIRAAAEKSVLHPAFRDGPGHRAAHGWFALALTLAGDHRAAVAHFDAIGDTPTRMPWEYFPSPARTFTQAKEEVHRAVGRR
ncbi:hypothetical protein [Actinoplanes sp. NPDC049316]|uniref:hypothetical protein n=1 Tax=Actinoplanes sp. NPDC049316 TaxID=3154727 RepID=UPI0034210B1F